MSREKEWSKTPQGLVNRIIDRGGAIKALAEKHGKLVGGATCGMENEAGRCGLEAEVIVAAFAEIHVLAGEARVLGAALEAQLMPPPEGGTRGQDEHCALEGIISLHGDLGIELGHAKHLASHSIDIVEDLCVSLLGGGTLSKLQAEQRDITLACIGGIVAVLEKADALSLQLDGFIGQGMKER